MPDLVLLTRGAPVAGLLLAVMVAASVAAWTVFPGWAQQQLLRPYGLVRRGDYLTIVTSGFLHADLAHLAFNAFSFWAFGFDLERHLGSAAFAGLYAAGLLISAAGTWVQHRHEPDYRSLGASGAILAVIFAAIVYFPGATLLLLPIPVPIPAPLFAIGYLGYSLWAARHARGRVNHDAHLWGAVAGLAFVALTDPAAFTHAWRTWLG